MTITTTSIRNAIVCGIGSLILGKALTTQFAKIFLVTLACLVAAQAIAMSENDEKKLKVNDDDDDDVVALPEEMDLGATVDDDGRKSKKIEEDNTFEVAEEDIAESYVLVDDDKKEKKEKGATGMILLKDSFAEGKTMENGTIGGVTGLATAAGIDIATGGSNGNRSSSKIIADDPPNINEFVEQYCDDLIDTAVAEVLKEVVSRVVNIGGNQEEEEKEEEEQKQKQQSSR